MIQPSLPTTTAFEVLPNDRTKLSVDIPFEHTLNRVQENLLVCRNTTLMVFRYIDILIYIGISGSPLRWRIWRNPTNSSHYVANLPIRFVQILSEAEYRSAEGFWLPGPSRYAEIVKLIKRERWDTDFQPSTRNFKTWDNYLNATAFDFIYIPQKVY